MYIYGQVMGLRGPKPVDNNLLKADACAWACLFYNLRDGQAGSVQKMKWGPVQNTGSARWTRILAGRGAIMLPPNTLYRASEALSPLILIPVSKAAQELPAEMKSKGWLISRPVMPAPRIWTLLKRARTTEEISRASREMRRWMTKEYGEGVGRWLPGSQPTEFADVLELHADKILIAKRLPTYAKTDRKRSDDKRVVFLSKILAGARFGLAPITAAKRLSHWHWPRDWDEKSMKEYVEWSKTEFAKSRKEKVHTLGGTVEVLKMGLRNVGVDAITDKTDKLD
jgi:hypothetical protein